MTGGINICGVMKENENEVNLFACIQAMKNKQLEYFKIIPPIYLVACVFDPHYKLDELTD